MARGVGTALHPGDERLLAHRPSSSKAKTGIRVRMDSRVAVPRQHVGRKVMSHELPTAGVQECEPADWQHHSWICVRDRSKARWGLQEQTALRWRLLCAKKRVQRLDPRMGGGRLLPKLPDRCVRSGLLAPTVHPEPSRTRSAPICRASSPLVSADCGARVHARTDAARHKDMAALHRPLGRGASNDSRKKSL